MKKTKKTTAVIHHRRERDTLFWNHVSQSLPASPIHAPHNIQHFVNLQPFTHNSGHTFLSHRTFLTQKSGIPRGVFPYYTDWSFMYRAKQINNQHTSSTGRELACWHKKNTAQVQKVKKIQLRDRNLQTDLNQPLLVQSCCQWQMFLHCCKHKYNWLDLIQNYKLQHLTLIKLKTTSEIHILIKLDYFQSNRTNDHMPFMIGLSRV